MSLRGAVCRLCVLALKDIFVFDIPLKILNAFKSLRYYKISTFDRRSVGRGLVAAPFFDEGGHVIGYGRFEEHFLSGDGMHES